MNRELKFRVWLPQHNQLIYPHLCDFIRAKDDYIIGQIIPYFKYEKGLSIDAQFVNYNFSKDQLGEVNEYYTEIEYIVQQYTGLKDRDGKDIYEGDIVKALPATRYGMGIDQGQYDYMLLRTPKIVLYKDCSFKLFDKNDITSMNYRIDNDVEIIGNIFENPELFNS